jgi:hypothetical protein
VKWSGLSTSSRLQARASFPKQGASGAARGGEQAGVATQAEAQDAQDLTQDKDDEALKQAKRATQGVFFHSVAAGDVASVRKFLSMELVGVQELDDGNDNSPLHWAAATGCIDTCRVLVGEIES